LVETRDVLHGIYLISKKGLTEKNIQGCFFTPLGFNYENLYEEYMPTTFTMQAPMYTILLDNHFALSYHLLQSVSSTFHGYKICSKFSPVLKLEHYILSFYAYMSTHLSVKVKYI
jgi:hypothetical protein